LEIMRDCRRGNAAAFEPLVLSHQGDALAIAETLLLDPDDAADAVQEAFIRAYRGLGKLAEGSAFGPWFRSIVRNLCLDRLRSPARRRREALTDAVDAWVSVEPVGTARLERQDLAHSINAALRSLPAAHREVLVLKELEGLRYSDIAGALGIPPGTVASRVYHARAALKRALIAMGVDSTEVAS
jgi:RNA polymerase sigma-70 factor (ECF subfamily)